MPRVPMPSLVVALGLCVAGCHLVTFGAVNPRPHVSVPDTARSYSLEVGRVVPDDQVLDTIAIRQFRTTLRNGFQNAAGDRFVAAPQAGTCRLVVDRATLSTADIGKVGKFLTLTYRARWLDENGAILAELVGMAQPRDPVETRPRHLEDVVEVMYEQLIEGLEGVDAKVSAADRPVAKYQ
jgi:hypothetical protein